MMQETQSPLPLDSSSAPTVRAECKDGKALANRAEGPDIGSEESRDS